VTLTATATPGAAINWYTSATGGFSWSTGNVFHTPQIASNTYFYAEPSLNGCTTAVRTPVLARILNCRLANGETDNSDGEVVELTEILPNPSETNFNLIVHSIEEKTITISVMDINGQVVQEGKTNTNEPYIFGDEFSAGVYVVKVINGEDIKTYKVMKIK
jgi:hypothetical protein